MEKSSPQNIAVKAHIKLAAVMMRRGVQTHFTADHAIERARERRTLTGIEHWAPRAGPVRITRGEIEGLPGTLKRMDVCIRL